MRKVTVVLAMLSAVCVSACAALVTAGPALARSACVPVGPGRLTPHLLAPCDDATVPRHRVVTFVVYDRDPAATTSTQDRPYLDLQPARRLRDGHLLDNTDGTGIFVQLTPLAGHPNEWTLVSRPQPYRSWWDNHAGTDYLQIQQIDPAAGADAIAYSAIFTLRVGR